MFFLKISWRKWPDALIDFGRELYIPWRLAEGAVLYRDADDFYGPLSHYFNAALFKCFGTGMMVLVYANLLIFAAIVATLYFVFRRAWGATAAFVASAIFIAVFGFSQFIEVGNYNYATPYAHSTTHGMLVCLLLIALLGRWMDKPSSAASFFAGLLCGLTAVLKPEFMLAAGMLMAAVVFICWRQRILPGWRMPLYWAIGAVIPTLIFFACFAAVVPVGDAFAGSTRAWGSVVTRQFSKAIQDGFLGFDDPWPHAEDHLGAILMAGLVIGAIAGAAVIVDRAEHKRVRTVIATVAVGAVLWVSAVKIDWLLTGRCLLGLLMAYTAVIGWRFTRRSTGERADGSEIARILVAVLAIALMARMILNGRIYHFGYYQAAIATVLIPAALIRELPEWLKCGKSGRTTVIAATLALLLPGVVILASRSAAVLDRKTHPIGEGADRFYTFPPEQEPMGEIVRIVTVSLKRLPPGQKLLVLPEGLMINYLSRHPSPLAPFFFFSAATRDGREEKLVQQLESNPPDWVIIVSRDLREYGIENYGQTAGDGKLILDWVVENCEVTGNAGGSPLDPGEKGALMLKYHPRR